MKTDFVDILKNIKKEMQTYSKSASLVKNKSVKNLQKQTKKACAKTQEVNINAEKSELFLKQKKLQDEFACLIKDTSIKKF